MVFDKKELLVPSTDGVHTLAGTLYIPKGEIKGIFHLVHGMREYIGRYEHFLPIFAQAGFLCVGFDNLGHGNTAKGDSELGFISEKGGYRFLIDDVNAFAEHIKKDYPFLPYILMGHSMGSFIARLAAAKYPRLADKLIICGTSGSNPAASAGLLIADILKVFKGARGYSPFLELMAFGSYNKRFEGNSKHAWLTKNPETVAKYKQDKFCNFHFTISAMHDLISLNKRCNLQGWYKSLNKDIPVLLVSGSEDPVGNYGKGVREVYDRLLKSGQKNVTLHLYENCRHEIHNDSCAEQSADDILNFITEE